MTGKSIAFAAAALSLLPLREAMTQTPAAPIPASAECYSCHRQHAAVDTTFVQFYPTLIDLATKKGTLSAAYLQDQEKGEAKR
jgi:hypothetical protein